MASGWWLVVGGWWLVVGGWWLVADGWWLVVGGWWLVFVGWWVVGGGPHAAIPLPVPMENRRRWDRKKEERIRHAGQTALYSLHLDWTIESIVLASELVRCCLSLR